MQLHILIESIIYTSEIKQINASRIDNILYEFEFELIL